MTEVVDIGDVELHVTPVSELPFPMRIAVAMIGGRIARKSETAEHAADIESDIYEVLEICVEDGIRRETLQSLNAKELAAILDVVFEDPDMGEAEAE